MLKVDNIGQYYIIVESRVRLIVNLIQLNWLNE